MCRYSIEVRLLEKGSNYLPNNTIHTIRYGQYKSAAHIFTIYNFSFFVLATAGARRPPLTAAFDILFYRVINPT